ncbi:hypothetical protein P280DRAFT_168044 [Massarina eburnea CBS 473.64]|uniref:Uncharacterized protein n=1 Tax=Massarina eburnea CBS 473.64 TaxID=1395130 RepID=A0A6A6RKA2_9PLEO|nr:hypothetical protein P280DRAFT_168044 [Massarina eburnea CBS 473.64]
MCDRRICLMNSNLEDTNAEIYSRTTTTPNSSLPPPSHQLMSPTPSNTTPSSSPSSSHDHDHILLATTKDRTFHSWIATNTGTASVSRYGVLEIHLNGDANALNGKEEDRLAAFLTCFHPNGDEGTNPHRLRGVRVCVGGKTLVTRWRYCLVTRGEGEVDGEGGDGVVDPTRGFFKVHSTERAFARALLGIRGVGIVEFVVGRGGGRLEAGFQATIDKTLRYAPGRGIGKVASGDTGSWCSTPGLDGVGVFTHGAGGGEGGGGMVGGFKLHIGEEADWEVVDEKVWVRGHLAGKSEEDVLIEAVGAAKGRKSGGLMTFDEDCGRFEGEPMGVSRGGNRLAPATKSKRKGPPSQSLPVPAPHGLGMADMVVVNRQTLSKKDEECGIHLPNLVEMGWRL